MHTAFSDVIETFGKAFGNQCLRREDKMVAFKLNFQIVPRYQPELVVKLLRDNHLAGYPNFDSRHGVSLLELYFIYLYITVSGFPVKSM